MGFAFFTLRKLMLTKQIDNLQVRVDDLSQKEDQLSNIGSTMGAYSSAFSVFSTNSPSIGTALNANTSFTQILKNADKAVQSQIDNGYGDASIWKQYQNTIDTTMKNLGSWANVTPTQLATIESQVECERKSLETQLAAKQTELKSVETAEEKSIQASAPKLTSS